MPEEEPIELEPNEPQPLKFKVVSDDYKATTTLDENWQAKPFLAAVVKPVAMKLNKRPDKEPVSADRLERVEIDGVEVDFSVQAPVASVVPAGASTVELFFGLAPPKELKFSVSAGGNSEMSFTITLDSKFMQKTFHDAVIVPVRSGKLSYLHAQIRVADCPAAARACASSSRTTTGECTCPSRRSNAWWFTVLDASFQPPFDLTFLAFVSPEAMRFSCSFLKLSLKKTPAPFTLKLPP
jgi:hypothetical protein